MTPRRRTVSIFLMPFLIVIGTLTGLFAGLFSDGIGNWLAWLGLGVPALLCMVLPVRRSRIDTER